MLFIPTLFLSFHKRCSWMVQCQKKVLRFSAKPLSIIVVRVAFHDVGPESSTIPLAASPIHVSFR